VECTITSSINRERERESSLRRCSLVGCLANDTAGRILLIGIQGALCIVNHTGKLFCRASRANEWMLDQAATMTLVASTRQSASGQATYSQQIGSCPAKRCITMQALNQKVLEFVGVTLRMLDWWQAFCDDQKQCLHTWESRGGECE
jgi:hypothetical protein